MNISAISLNNKTSIKKKRFSWNAILLGLIVSLSLQLIFNLLGVGLGFLTVAVDMDSVKKMSAVSVSWILGSGIFVMLLGGWITGNFTYVKMRRDNAIYGLVTWGAATLITFMFVFSAAGSFISTTFEIAKQTMSMGKEAVPHVIKVAPGIANTVKNLLPDLSEIQNQIKQQAIESVKSMKLAKVGQLFQGDNKRRFIEIVGDILMAENDREIMSAKEKALEFLTQTIGMNEEEANRAISEWLNEYNNLKEKITHKARQVKESAIATTERATDVIGTLSLVTALAFLSSGVASALGSIIGSNRFRN